MLTHTYPTCSPSTADAVSVTVPQAAARPTGAAAAAAHSKARMRAYTYGYLRCDQGQSLASDAVFGERGDTHRCEVLRSVIDES